MGRRIRITGKVEYLSKSEYYVQSGENDTFELPDGLPENATKEQIIEAIDDRLGELDWQLENDKEHIEDVEYYFEFVED